MDAENRQHLLVWLEGPVGAGKSAVAQTFAEFCREHRRLGAAFFFSTLNGRNRHNGLIPTIAYQLAVQHTGYKRCIARILADDPAIFGKTLPEQFRKFITEPFDLLTTQGLISTQNQLAVIIDGLDECDNEEAQRELIELIGKYVNSARPSRCPLLWLICSRPEWHLKATFARAEALIQYTHQKITCDAEQDVADVYCILKDGLQKIRIKTSNSLAPRSTGQIQQWPQETKLRQLSRAIGGLPVLADAVIRFVDNGGNPASQLDACILFLQDVKSTSVNPLERLDMFYRHIMIRIPAHTLPSTKRIISFCLILSKEVLQEKISTAFSIAHFLGLEEDDFYGPLRFLHSVLKIPSSETAHERPIQFFHKSFGEYLQDKSRSGDFALDMDEARLEVAKIAIQQYNQISHRNCTLGLSSSSHFSLSYLIDDS
jgi:hypothetical protein